MPQDIENNFVSFDKRSFKAGGAKLQNGIAFVKVPSQCGAGGYGALEAGVRFLDSETHGCMGIEDKNDAAVILTSELPDHERTQPRRGFPMHMARAVAGLIVAQRV